MRTYFLLPMALLGLAGCVATTEPGQTTATTYIPATTTTHTYTTPAPGQPYLAPTSTSTTYTTSGPAYVAPGSTTTVVSTP